VILQKHQFGDDHRVPERGGGALEFLLEKPSGGLSGLKINVTRETFGAISLLGPPSRDGARRRTLGAGCALPGDLTSKALLAALACSAKSLPSEGVRYA